MIDLEVLERAIRDGDEDAVAVLFDGASEVERRTAIPTIKALSEEEARFWRVHHDNQPCPIGFRALEVARFATAMTATEAAASAGWDPTHWGGTKDTGRSARVILQRNVGWKRELVALLVGDAAPTAGVVSHPNWPLIDALMEQLGLCHLDEPAYAERHLARLSPRLDWPPTAATVLRVEPHAPSLIGWALRSARVDLMSPHPWNDPDVQDRWPLAAAALSAAGHLDRLVLQEAVLSALLRGGLRPHLTALLKYLAALQPQPHEILHARRDYLALVDSTASGVATAAVSALLSADQAGALDNEARWDAIGRALTRSDVGASNVATRWLTWVLRTQPGSADMVARVASVGFGHPTRGIQLACQSIAERARPGATTETSALVDIRVEDLGPTIRGMDVRPALPDRPPRPTRPAPVPRASDAQTFLQLLHEYKASDFDHFAEERFLDAAATLFATGASELFARGFSPQVMQDLQDREVTRQLAPLLRPASATAAQHLSGGADPRLSHDVSHVPRLRSREIHGAIVDGRSRPLLAFPSDRIGFVDPDAVVDGLLRMRNDGVAALPLDLEQAWLRLSVATYDGDLAARLRVIGTPDALWLATELDAGPLAPPTLTLNPPIPAGLTGQPGNPRWFTIAWEPTQDRGSRLTQAIQRTTIGNVHHRLDHVPRVLPTQRDFVAAMIGRAAAEVSESRWSLGGLIAPLPFLEGPAGPATELTLAYAAASEGPSVRTEALDAILGLLSLGVTQFGAVTEAWGMAADDDAIKFGRWHGVLSDVADSSLAGARYVWAALHGVLAGRLPELSRRTSIADLVGLAADAASTVGARGPLDGLDAVADRGGRGRLATEAKRLRSVLAGA